MSIAGALRYTTLPDCSRVWRFYAHPGAPEHVVAGLAACTRAAAVIGSMMLPSVAPILAPARIVLTDTGYLALSSPWMQTLGAVPFALPGSAFVHAAAPIDVPEPASWGVLILPVGVMVMRRVLA